MINGQSFVNGSDFVGMQVKSRENKLLESDVEGLFDIYFGNGLKFDIYSSSLTGELKALIDIRDGNNNAHTLSAKTSMTGNVLTIENLRQWDFSTDGYVELTVGGRRYQVEYSSLVHNIDLTKTPPEVMSISITLDNVNTGLLTQLQSASASGTLTAALERTTGYKGIPHYLNKLNELVRTFTQAINAEHTSGYDANGNTGNQFFTYNLKTQPIGNQDPSNHFGSDGSITNIWLLNAGNFMVCDMLARDPERLASSDDPNPADPTDESNNRLILALLEVKNNKSLFREGKLSDFILGIASELGIDVRQAKKFEKNYAEIVTYVDNQREQVSGVSIDEEMMSMIKYQQLYQAASKLVNVIDGMYDTLINRLGRAGR
jgi:flagellar hook-associated protein 1 FlgK